MEQLYPNRRWDLYFHSICYSVASKSPCLSRKIGAILVKDNIVISTGYNGPARGIPHCGHNRFMKDEALRESLEAVVPCIPREEIGTTCPRKLLGYLSREGLDLCPAEHAERNCIASAARLGISVKGSILYMNFCIPCKNCLTLLINAGIKEIVVDNKTLYDKHSKFILDNSGIRVREFDLWED
jgi:dCMP deaminase